MVKHENMGDYAGVEVHRVNSDVNGNPRYVVHYAEMLPDAPYNASSRDDLDSLVVRQVAEFDIASRALSGRAYRGAWMGGGIEFSTYENLESYIAEARGRVYLEFARAGFID